MSDDAKMKLTDFLSSLKRVFTKGKSKKDNDGVEIPSELLNERFIKTNLPTTGAIEYVLYNAALAECMKLPVYEKLNDRYMETMMSHKGWKTEINLRAMHNLEEEKIFETGRRGEVMDE